MTSTTSNPQYAVSEFDDTSYPPASSVSPSSATYADAHVDDDQFKRTSMDIGGMSSSGDGHQQHLDDHDHEHDQDQDQDQDNPRPWSELKTKAGKERKRLPLACIVCRRKKIRCSGEKPACKHCFRSRIPCVYKVTTRKAAPRTDYMAMLDKRLKRMEERVIKIIPRDEHRDMAGIGRAVVKPAQAGQTPRAPRTIHKKRSADEAFNTELNEWARSNPSFSRIPWQPQVAEENSLLVEGAECLPSMEIQEHLAEVFFDCVYGQSYLLLHKPSFMRRLKAKAVPPVLILAVCAVSARFSSHPQLNTEPPFLRGEDWADSASAIALKRHDEPNITILTVLLILGLHEFGACHGGRSWSFGGQALRMAYALQLHRELDHDPMGHNNKASELSFTDREIRRRTMWACLLMDRYNSSGSQRPPIGNEKFIHIQLPVKESHFQMEIPGPTEDLEGTVPNPSPEGIGELSDPKQNMGVSAYIIKGIILWGRIVDYLNLGGRMRDPHPFWSPDSLYAKLKQQLEEFSATLPENLAFTSENLRNHAAEKTANQFIFLHIIIHQNILFLNRFAIPLSPGGRPPKDVPRQFFSDAGRATVEAAAHISNLISQASGYMLTVPFAGYCAYAASTVHIWGMFSRNAQLEARSKENLRHAYRYLNKMKRYWGMFHYMVESAKDRYRHFADAAMKGSKSSEDSGDSAIFQYGDWFDKYPHGVSRTHWEDPTPDVKRADGGDAVMGQKSDLQSVEEFFASLVPPSHSELPPRKEPRRGDSQRHAVSSMPAAPSGTSAPPLHSEPISSHSLRQPQLQPSNQPPPIVDTPMSQAQPLLNTNSSPEFSTFHSPPVVPPPPPVQLPFNGQPPLGYSFNPEPLHQLDRQLVYDAYHRVNQATLPSQSSLPISTGPANVDPNASHAVPDVSAADNQSWFMPHDLLGGQNWAPELLQPNAWFLPFNLDAMGGGMDMSVNPQSASLNPTPPTINGSQYGATSSPATLLDGFSIGLGISSDIGAGRGLGQESNGQRK